MNKTKYNTWFATKRKTDMENQRTRNGHEQPYFSEQGTNIHKNHDKVDKSLQKHMFHFSTGLRTHGSTQSHEEEVMTRVWVASNPQRSLFSHRVKTGHLNNCSTSWLRFKDSRSTSCWTDVERKSVSSLRCGFMRRQATSPVGLFSLRRISHYSVSRNKV